MGQSAAGQHMHFTIAETVTPPSIAVPGALLGGLRDTEEALRGRLSKLYMHHDKSTNLTQQSLPVQVRTRVL